MALGLIKSFLNYGDEDPKPKTRQIQPHEMSEWNSFLDFVKSKGYEGSPDLNKRDKNLGQSLFNEFKKQNPNVTINYDIVPSVQAEMQKVQKSFQDFAQRHGDPNAKNIMSGVSPVDGWLGSKTSQFRFPYAQEKVFNNGSLVSDTNLGLIGGNFRPTGAATSNMQSSSVPAGKKVEKMSDGKYYYEDDNGDLVPVKQ